MPRDPKCQCIWMQDTDSWVQPKYTKQLGGLGGWERHMAQYTPARYLQLEESGLHILYDWFMRQVQDYRAEVS